MRITATEAGIIRAAERVGRREAEARRQNHARRFYRTGFRSEGSVDQSVRVDGHGVLRRRRRASGQLTAKSISINMPKTAKLTQEICPVSLRRLKLSRGNLTAGQKRAEGLVGRDVGKASEALRNRKESKGTPNLERWLKARPRGAASRTWVSRAKFSRIFRPN
jgi:hypothetical protein